MARALLLLFCAACGPPAKPVPAKYEEVASFHKTTCGNCHARVEPGARTREQFEKAMTRHHTRVKLPGDEWLVLIDYLSETP